MIIGKWFEQPFATPLILFFISILSYGLLINRLGYYWDDYPISYIYNIFGRAGLDNYFSTNRPIWGLLYQLTFSLFNHPWQWQINALLWRWISAVIFWAILVEILPKNKYIALWASLLFLVYPGFEQQHISVVYSNLFIILDCFLLSFLLNIKAVKSYQQKGARRIFWLLTGLAMLLGLFNLLTLEYFFTLELLRPFLLWFVLSNDYSLKWKKVKELLFQWLPYLILWVAVVIWRIFFFSYQTHNYQMLFFKSLLEKPIDAIINLIKSIVTSLWVVLFEAWFQAFKLQNINQIGIRTFVVMLAIIFLCLGIVFLVLLVNRNISQDNKNFTSLTLMGLFACLLGGIPWWLIELPPTLRFPSDRFTIPFIFGVCLVIAGLVGLIPLSSWVKALGVGILVAFAVGSQFQVTNQFRRDWETQRRFFWQLSWRIPRLVDGTTLMVNDLPVTYYSDNSLTAPLNWFWAPTNNTQDMSYLLLYPSQRLGSSLASLNPDTVISVDYLATKFSGNTSQTVSIYYSPPACLRVLDSVIDSNNRMLPKEMQSAAMLSSTDWIQISDTSPQVLPADLYAPEPEHMWCYYFELADIARQQDKWDDVASLGDTAYQLNDYPNDPSEHFVFIEGYAHTGNWDKAQALSEQSLNVTPLMKPLLCQLWHRIDAATAENQDKVKALNNIYSILNCE